MGHYCHYVKKDKDKETNTLYRVSVLGGESTKLIENIDSPVTLSPDGKSIVTGIVVPNRRGQNPDRLAEVRVDGGTIKEITSQAWGAIDQMTWMGDGSGFLMSAADQSTGCFFQIWFVSYPDGKARKVTNDPNNYRGTSLSRDSSVLLTTQSDWLSNIWIAPDGDSSRAAPITAGKYDGTAGVAWASGGKIVYGTRDWDIWIMDEDGSNQRLLTVDEHNNRCPAVSPDGRTIYFESWRNGDNNIWRMGIDGSGAIKLTNGWGDSYPSCSPDGQALTYSVRQGGISNIWIQPLAGGPARQLTNFTTDNIWDFDWTPDNRLILARGPVNQDVVLISSRELR